MNNKPDKTKIIVFGALAGIGIIAISAIICVWIFSSQSAQVSKSATNDKLALMDYTKSAEEFDEVKALDKKFKKAFRELNLLREKNEMVWINLIADIGTNMRNEFDREMVPLRKAGMSMGLNDTSLKKFMSEKENELNNRYLKKYRCWEKFDEFVSRYPVKELSAFVKEYFDNKERELRALYKRMREETIKRAKKIRA